MRDFHFCGRFAFITTQIRYLFRLSLDDKLMTKGASKIPTRPGVIEDNETADNVEREGKTRRATRLH